MASVLMGAAVLLQQVVHHGFSLALVSHRLPFWFLVFSLFLPRVSLLVAWFYGVLVPFHLHGWIPLVCAILLPRVLVLFLIYVDQGVSLWFLIHLVVAVAVWAGGGRTYQARRHHG